MSYPTLQFSLPLATKVPTSNTMNRRLHHNTMALLVSRQYAVTGDTIQNPTIQPTRHQRSRAQTTNNEVGMARRVEAHWKCGPRPLKGGCNPQPRPAWANEVAPDVARREADDAKKSIGERRDRRGTIYSKPCREGNQTPSKWWSLDWQGCATK